MITDHIERCSDPKQLPSIDLVDLVDRFILEVKDFHNPRPYDVTDLRWMLEALVYHKMRQMRSEISDIYYNNETYRTLIFLLLASVDRDSYTRSVLWSHPEDVVNRPSLFYYFANRLERQSIKSGEEFFVDMLFWLVRGKIVRLPPVIKETIHRCEFNCRIKNGTYTLYHDIQSDRLKINTYISMIVYSVMKRNREASLDDISDILASSVFYLLVTLFTRGSMLYKKSCSRRNALVNWYRVTIARL